MNPIQGVDGVDGVYRGYYESESDHSYEFNLIQFQFVLLLNLDMLKQLMDPINNG